MMSLTSPGRLVRPSSHQFCDEIHCVQIFTPILHWIDGKDGPAPHPIPYPYGSRGPVELDHFIGRYGFKRFEEA